MSLSCRGIGCVSDVVVIVGRSTGGGDDSIGGGGFWYRHLCRSRSCHSRLVRVDGDFGVCAGVVGVGVCGVGVCDIVGVNGSARLESCIGVGVSAVVFIDVYVVVVYVVVSVIGVVSVVGVVGVGVDVAVAEVGVVVL